MIRIAFVIGGYPPEEYQRRADVARSYATAEIEGGIIDAQASPYFYGITPAEVQLVAPAYIASFRQAEKEGYHAVVPLGMLDLGVDGGKSAVDIPVVGPMEAALHIACLLGDRCGLIIYHEKLLAFNRAIVRRTEGVRRPRQARAGGTRATRISPTEAAVPESSYLAAERGAERGRGVQRRSLPRTASAAGRQGRASGAV